MKEEEMVKQVKDLLIFQFVIIGSLPIIISVTIILELLDMNGWVAFGVWFVVMVGCTLGRILRLYLSLKNRVEKKEKRHPEKTAI